MEDSIYVNGIRYMVFGEEGASGLYKLKEGGKYFGFTVPTVSDNYAWIDLYDGQTHPLESGRWLHFEDIKTVTEEIYGDEFEETVGDIIDVAMGIYSTQVDFDKTELGGIDEDLTILAARTDEDGNPTSRIAVIIFSENDHPKYKRIVKLTKQLFLKEYKLWNDGDANALSFLEEHELRCDGYKPTDFGASYVLKRMFDYSLEYSLAEVFSELYDEGLSDEAVLHKLDEFMATFNCVVSYYGGMHYQHDAHKEGDGSGKVYHFTDDRVTIIDGDIDGMEDGLYNTDITRYNKYNMVIATLADLDYDELTKIRKNLIANIIKGDPTEDYLDTLGFPIFVQYNSKHYKRLAPTIEKDSGRLAQIMLEYTEEGHNPNGEAVNYHFTTTRFTMRAGYLCLYDNLYDEYNNHYPRNYEYIKIEEIGEDYIDVRLPRFFAECNEGAKSNETAPPRRIRMGETLTVEENQTVTCHKYHWDSTLKIKFIRS